MIKDVDNFYLNQTEPNQGCFLALRQLILKQDEYISETLKYGAPCFSYKNRMFCFLWKDKKTQEPYLLMVEGKNLNHPKLEAGNRARMKIFPIKPNDDLPLKTILQIITEALELYRSGRVKTK